MIITFKIIIRQIQMYIIKHVIAQFMLTNKMDNKIMAKMDNIKTKI